MGLTLQVIDKATPGLQQLKKHLPSRSLNKRIAARAANLTKRHFIAKNQEPNKRGWRKTNFYAKAAAAVHQIATEQEAAVGIAQIGIAQRYFGGTIAPVNKRALTIPLTEEAYGKRAGEFGDLHFVPSQSTNERVVGFLARRTGGDLEPLYLLLTQVNQEGDDSVLPKRREFETEAGKAIQSFLKSLDRKGIA